MAIQNKISKEYTLYQEFMFYNHTVSIFSVSTFLSSYGVKYDGDRRRQKITLGFGTLKNYHAFFLVYFSDTLSNQDGSVQFLSTHLTSASYVSVPLLGKPGFPG